MSLVNASRRHLADLYAQMVPKLWNETIESHRQAVHQAILEVAAKLVRAHGLAAVTMSQIAKDTGIGRATLYKYFPDVESILFAWQERQIADHLDQLARAGEGQEDPGLRLAAVLGAYARLAHAHRESDLAALLHHGERVGRARHQLHGFLAGLITEAAAAGEVRTDISADRLADYCLFALAAATAMPCEDAADKLVELTLSALRPPGKR